MAIQNFKSDLIDSLKNSIQTNRTTPDSVLNTLGNILGDSLNSFTTDMNNFYNQSVLENASGENLDRLSYSLYGNSISRISSRYAKSLKEEKNVEFTVEGNGTFGTINNGNDIIIPKGTRIAPNNLFDSLNNIIYQTLEDVILYKNDNYAFVSIIAMSPGKDFNVAQNSLIRHNFKNYAQFDLNKLLINNRFPILNGSNKEEDRFFLARIKNHISTLRMNSFDNITFESYKVPGLLDIRIIDSYYGIGTTGIVVFGAGQQSTEELARIVKQRLLETTRAGSKFYVITPIYCYIDFELTIKVSSNMSDSNKNNLKNRILNYLQLKFSNIIGEAYVDLRFINSDLLSLLRSYPEVLDINGNNNMLFQNVIIRKSNSQLDEGEEILNIVNNQFIIKKDEVLSVSNNIQINFVS